MHASQDIQCPFCGQYFAVMIDTDQGAQRFTTDCEICCRPLEISAQCEGGEILDLEVRAG